MKCKICKSNQVEKLKTFIPYYDKEWSFEIFECQECGTRFALRDESINYHEELHSNQDSPYLDHYIMAEKIKALLEKNELKKCEKILRNKSPVVVEVLEYISSQDKNISILEIGCSTGYITAYLQKIGYKNTLGIDISSYAIDYAKSTFGNFYALKENNMKKYDVIFHTGVIGCVDNPIDFLNYYLDLLTNGGIMFFNAPNVASVKETGELWVSTPPPDLIYLFDKYVFFKKLDNKNYSIKVRTMFTPLNILRKNINKYKNKKNNIYPRSFYKKNNFYKKNKKFVNSKNNLIKHIFKIIISFIIRILVKFNILKAFSDEYGIIIKIKKINNKK